MALKRGSFILIDYVAKVKETGEVFDTTLEEEARKHEIYRADVFYEPMLVVLGEGWVVKGLEEALMEMNVGEKKTVEVPPEKGFGRRDPSKIRLVPLRMFRGETGLRPGARVEYRGMTATVRSISAGRVQLDFNPPLAGKTLVYEVEVKEEITDPLGKIKALLHRRLPSVPVDKFSLSLESGVLTVKMPDETYMLDGIQFIKRGFAGDVLRFLPEVSKIVFVEEYARRVEAKPEEAKTAEKPEEKTEEKPASEEPS